MRVAKCQICGGPSEKCVSVRAHGAPASSCGKLGDLCNTCFAAPNNMAVLQEKFFPSESARETVRLEAERKRLYNESKAEYYHKHPEETWVPG